jgi:hypothetical protein
METFLIYITYGGHHDERYVRAVSVESAIAQVRSELPRSIVRFANVFA